MTSGERSYITVHVADVTCTRYTSNVLQILWRTSICYGQIGKYSCKVRYILEKRAQSFTCHLLFSPQTVCLWVWVHLHCLKDVTRNKLEELITSTFTSKPNGIFSQQVQSDGIKFKHTHQQLINPIWQIRSSNSHKRLFMNEINTSIHIFVWFYTKI